MADREKLVIMATHGPEDPERATIPFVMACAALASDVDGRHGLPGRRRRARAARAKPRHVLAPELPAPGEAPRRLPRARRPAARLLAVREEPRRSRPTTSSPGAEVVAAGRFVAEVTSATNSARLLIRSQPAIAAATDTKETTPMTTMTAPLSDTDLLRSRAPRSSTPAAAPARARSSRPRRRMSTVPIGSDHRDLVERPGHQDRHRRLVGQGRPHVSSGPSPGEGYERIFVVRAEVATDAGRRRPRRSRGAMPAMTTLAPEKPQEAARTFVPRILVFSTNNISDPGIDLAGSAHMNYSPGVVVISLPCTSGIRPSWILHAIEQGFDGVFIASDGDECAYLPDCSKRASRIVAAGPGAPARARALDPQRLQMAAICSVCAEPFTRHVQQFGQALADARARRRRRSMTGLRRPRRRRRHRGHGVGPQARRHGLPGPARREGGQRRREDDPAQQGLPDARLRELHLDAEDGGVHPPPQRHDADLQRGRRASSRSADGRFQATITQQGALRRRGRLHRLPAVRDGLHRRRARPVQRRPGRPPRGLHRLPPGRAEEGGHRARRHRRPARSPARPASRPTATSRSSAAASTRRPSSSCSTRRRSSARSGAPATRRARWTAPAARSRGPLPIRRLKRFIADEHYDRFDGPGVEIAPSRTATGSPSSAPGRPA